MKKSKKSLKIRCSQLYANLTQGRNLVIFKIAISILVVVVLAIIFSYGSKKGIETSNDTPLVDFTQVETVEPVETVITQRKGASVSAVNNVPPKIAYEQALFMYKESRLQLSGNDTCSPIPAKMSLVNGSKIMIDNRSPHTRTIDIGSKHTIHGYDFEIVTVRSDILPSEILVDCNEQQNIATIYVQ